MTTRRKFSAVAAPVEKPIPLWILYPLFFVAVYLSHYSLLRLPFYWDEAGYYIPAALDFLRTRSLIPHSTLTNAHPPLPSVLLAGWWRLGGLASGSLMGGTRTFVAMVAAAGLLGVFRLARVLTDSVVAAIVTLLTAIYPVWFAQSTLAHADIFAAAFTLWALSFYFERFESQGGGGRLGAMAGLFSLAALSKETAIVTPVALGLWEIVLRATDKESGATWRWAAALFVPAVPLAGWYLYHLHVTGFMFGNPEFLRYNATANFTAGRLLASLWHRFVHLAVHMNLYVPVLATVAALLMPKVAGARGLKRGAVLAIAIVVAGNGIAFSILGGALLTRYLLPVYPLELLVCVAVWQSRGSVMWGLTALTAAGFLAGLWVNPPYPIAPEDNLTYRDMIVLHQQAIAVIAARYPGATVLSAWPATSEMQFPELGYTRKPLKTVAIDNFSREQIEKAAGDPGAYDTALVFSTKWVPRGWNLGGGHEATDARYYDFHRDLQPDEIARMLQGDVVWQGKRNGEWTAVLRFPRSMEAGLPLGTGRGWSPAFSMIGLEDQP